MDDLDTARLLMRAAQRRGKATYLPVLSAWPRTKMVFQRIRPGEKLHEELLIGAGLLTTPHSKILRAREDSLSELEMASALRALRRASGPWRISCAGRPDRRVRRAIA